MLLKNISPNKIKTVVDQQLIMQKYILVLKYIQQLFQLLSTTSPSPFSLIHKKNKKLPIS